MKKLIMSLFMMIIGINCFSRELEKRVLLISSYNPAFPTYYQQIQGIKSVIKKENIIFDVEFMDSKRLYTKADKNNFKKYLKYKLEKLKTYDLIMCADDNALDFIEKNKTELFPRKPVIFFGVNNIKKAMQHEKSDLITGVVESVSMEETIELMKKIQPNLENIVAISDTTPSGKGDLQTFLEIKKKIGNTNYYVFSTEELSFDELKNRLKLLNQKNTAILLLSLYRDGYGNEFLSFDEGLKFISNNTKAHVYHLWEHGIGDGILGGKVISHFDQGQEAALMAMQVLSGEPVENIPIMKESPNRYYFDYKELKKHNIKENILPKNSVIVNKTESIFVKYKVLICHIIGILILLIVIVIVLTRNIANQKANSKSLELLNESLNKANEAKSKFLANVSHEIRTPMNGIMGMTELLNYTKLTKEQIEYLKAIEISSENLLKIINDILDISKIESGKIELENMKFNLEKEIEILMSRFAIPAHKKGLELLLEIDNNVPVNLIGDIGKIRQIINNLISNALKFTDCGEVEFKIEKVYQLEDKVQLKFTVRDTGIGIATDKAKVIFEPFAQGDISYDKKYEGTGLGLSISKRLVELLGGELSVKSIPGKGSIFEFHTVLKHIEEDQDKEEKIEYRLKKDLQIMLVDDNKINCRIVSKILTMSGMNVDIFYSGEEALKNFKQAEYDLILLDVHMPEMNGFELARKLNQNFDVARGMMMFFTSVDIRDQISEMQEIGISRYIVKPVKKQELLGNIFDLLNEIESPESQQRKMLQNNQIKNSKEKLKILAVEDNFINLKTLEKLLTKKSYEFVAAVNGAEALAKIENEKFDLILLDLQLPIINGYDVCKEIRKNKIYNRKGDKEIPIVALTAYAMESDKNKVLETGMNAYIAKPYRAEELYDVIDEIYQGV